MHCSTTHMLSAISAQRLIDAGGFFVSNFCGLILKWMNFGERNQVALADGSFFLCEDELNHSMSMQSSMHDGLPHYHEPVLLGETIELLEPRKGKLIVDCTLGGGGHTQAILNEGADVIAFDQDPVALKYASERLHAYDKRFTAIQSNFRNLGETLSNAGVHQVDGILADVGCSSRQLDDPARGFSFQSEGPLDMRMSPLSARTAADIVNEETQQELERIFSEYGEEPQARRIARGIIEHRKKSSFQTTTDLAHVIENLIGRHGKKHPATRVFQALRIAVNDELAALQEFLEQVPRCLKPGGRLVVISFHSLEDRLVKRAFQRFSAPTLDRPEWPAPKPNPEYCLHVLTRKAIEATEQETERNPRARSARLRAAERIDA